MRIAQISPLVESVPPKLYGGTERIVSYLSEELVRQGHEVALFASGDSETTAELIPCAPQALRLAHVDDTLPYSVLQLEKIRQRARNFDVLHFHWDYFHLPLVRCLASPAVTTMHGRMDLPNYQPLFAEFADMALVSVSDHQRKPLSARWIATVPHGLPVDLYSFSPEGAGGYLAFLGRICPEKRPDRAIEIARRAGVELKIAAKVDKVDMAYFEDVIRPLLRDPRVEFVGEVSDCEKQAFLAGAMALLFPIDWPEPFGLVQIEAMACGTPVIAWRRGSVPEVIEHGQTGFIVDGIDEAVAAVENVRMLSRVAVRRGFEKRFSIERVGRDYIRVYQSLADEPIVLTRGGARPDAEPKARRSAIDERIGERPPWPVAVEFGGDFALTEAALDDQGEAPKALSD
jgi:glycosyltransferase involved in cell wall biosynthesis